MFVKKFDLIKIREKVEVEDYISLYIFCNIVSYKKIFIFLSFFFMRHNCSNDNLTV